MATVLIVDDNPDEREIFSTVLHYNGFDVVEAEKGVDAINIVNDAVPDLILMDIKLPDMSGFLVTEILQQGLGVKSPVVCVTGLDVSEQAARERGCVSLLQKPVLPDVLVRAVHRALYPVQH